jgi:hypothetical protein
MTAQLINLAQWKQEHLPAPRSPSWIDLWVSWWFYPWTFTAYRGF